MKTASSQASTVGRRSELLAQLFLQDLQPKFLTKPTLDLGFDFLVGFNNTEGGVNTFAVEVKGTERSIESFFPVEKRLIRRLANSNVPGFLLAVDVKRNRLFYAWPERDDAELYHGQGRVSLPVTEINERTTPALRKRLLN
ncbi:MAG: DUF4365 domain-containing protein [Terracidiphilus sp.]